MDYIPVNAYARESCPEVRCSFTKKNTNGIDHYIFLDDMDNFNSIERHKIYADSALKHIVGVLYWYAKMMCRLCFELANITCVRYFLQIWKEFRLCLLRIRPPHDTVYIFRIGAPKVPMNDFQIILCIYIYVYILFGLVVFLYTNHYPTK